MLNRQFNQTHINTNNSMLESAGQEREGVCVLNVRVGGGKLQKKSVTKCEGESQESKGGREK